MASRYTPVSKEEMEELLFSRMGFKPNVNPLRIEGTNELVYGKGFRLGVFPLSLRVFTAINPSGESRPVGSDAIRVILVVRIAEEIKALTLPRKVLRTTNWRTNLGKRIAELEALIPQLSVCNVCGLPMAERYSKRNKSNFLGCVGYPECNKTAPL